MLSRPALRSAIRLRAPAAMLAPPVSIAFFSAAGFDISIRVGLIASTNWRRWKFTRCRSASSMSAVSPCSSSQSEASRYTSFNRR